jgi:hypothetical protein
MTISAGVDSEKARDFIQNGFHNLRGIKNVPLLERPERFYLHVCLFDWGMCY